MIYYKIDKDGYYLTDENLEKPPFKTVKIPKTKWELIDEIPTPINYFEEVPTEELDGYVDVQPPQGMYKAKWNFETKEWVETGSKPTETPQQEVERLKAELDEIDKQSIRPLRAIADNTATQFDKDKLTELDTQAQTIRLRLSELKGV